MKTIAPIQGHKLAELCWETMLGVDPNVDALLFREAVEYSGGKPTPESMSRFVEFVWKEGFTACLRAQELGAFARVENN